MCTVCLDDRPDFGHGGIAVSAQSTSIQWTKNAVVVDGNTAQNALKSVSSDGHVLVFNTSDQRIVNVAKRLEA